MREISEKRVKKHWSFATSKKDTSQHVTDLVKQVQKEIEENHDDDESVGDWEAPIDGLRTPTSKEKELIVENCKGQHIYSEGSGRLRL